MAWVFVLIAVFLVIFGPVLYRSWRTVHTENTAVKHPPRTGQVWQYTSRKECFRVEILSARPPKEDPIYVISPGTTIVHMLKTHWAPGTSLRESAEETATFDHLSWMAFIANNDLDLIKK